MVRVQHIMGTAVGIDVRDPGPATGAIDAAFALLREADARFSTHRGDSEVERFNRAEVSAPACSAEMCEVLGLCDEVRRSSQGAFDIRGLRPGGGIDPSGLVKGWAAQRAAELLVAAGVRNLCVNAGGDAVTRGEAGPGQSWRIGIRHPDQSHRVAAVLAAGDLAVATSGLYERGPYVVDPRTGELPTELVSATVVGPSLTYADAYATAALVLGTAALPWIASIPGYGGFVITADRRSIWTSVVGELLVRPGQGGSLPVSRGEP